MHPDTLELILKIGVPAVLILIGLFAGRVAERRHLASLARREAALQDVMLSNLRTYPGVALSPGEAGKAEIIMSHAVISSDYFKTFVSVLVGIIGGELKTLQTLMDRARREATVRMLEEAKAKGYNAVCNVRYDTIDISKGENKKKAVVMATIMACGTAYTRA